MTSRLRSRFRGASAFTAVAAALVLAGCNPSGSVDRSQSGPLPALPATLPLAPGDATAPGYAPAAALLPATRQIRTVRVADRRDGYAYAEDAWDFADALGDAPPDYGFYYGDAQPWAWQGYDDSLAFVEPLDDGYRYYYYRPGADTPYFVRDPYYGYGYDNGRLAVVYGRDGGLVPYADYGPRLDYASRYYVRGRDLYQASRQRRPVIAANWAARREAIVDTQHWATARASQRAWQDYHQRTEAQQAEHWREEQVRRRADTVRFAAWQGQDFRTPPPPRAIPAAWTRAKWAKDQNRFAPPAAGFDGDAAARERAATQERERVARPARERQAPGVFVAAPGMERQRPQPQDQQRADFARQQAERAQQARAVGDQQQAVRQQREAARQQQQAQVSQQAAARDAQIRTRLQVDRAAGEQVRQRQANERAQTQRVQAQRVQADMQQRRQEQARQGREQAQQRQAAAQAQQRAQGQARAQEQAIRAQQRQAAQPQREAAQAQRRAQGQARAQEQMAQAQQRQAAQAQQRAQMQAQIQQRQAAQAQQRAEMQARQRPPSAPPQVRAAPAARPQPAAPRMNPGNSGGQKHEPH